MAERVCLRVERRHCPHCKKYLSLKTYKAHKRLYFDRNDNVWLTEPEPEPDVDSAMLSGEESSPPHSDYEVEDIGGPLRQVSPPSECN